MSDPSQAEQTGTGGSSDDDTLPDDVGGQPVEHPDSSPTGEEQAERNREDEPPA